MIALKPLSHRPEKRSILWYFSLYKLASLWVKYFHNSMEETQWHIRAPGKAFRKGISLIELTRMFPDDATAEAMVHQGTLACGRVLS